MPIVTSDDVLAGVLAYWTANKGGVLAGGLTHQRPQVKATYPLGVLKITEGEREGFSGNHYIQPFTVEIAIETNVAPPNTGAIVGQVRSLFDEWQSRKQPAGFAINNADSIVRVKPVPGALEYAAETKDAQNMVIGRATWEILIQASY